MLFLFKELTKHENSFEYLNKDLYQVIKFKVCKLNKNVIYYIINQKIKILKLKLINKFKYL